MVSTCPCNGGFSSCGCGCRSEMFVVGEGVDLGLLMWLGLYFCREGWIQKWVRCAPSGNCES